MLMELTISLLPYEIIQMIYNHLYKPADVINLASVCVRMCHGVSKEHLRVLDIRKRYQCINESILNIRYYISTPKYRFPKRSIRIGVKYIKVYMNINIGADECFYDGIFRRGFRVYGRRLIDDLYWTRADSFLLGHHFIDDEAEILSILCERNIWM